jgi:phosphoserine phosphatase
MEEDEVSQIKTVIFDLDGTLVRYHGVEFESSWGAIAAAAGMQEASERLLSEYLPRREAYSEWVKRDAELLTGIPVTRITDRIFPPPYAAGVREAIARLRGDYRLGILSSGVDLVAEYVRDDLGLEFAVANRLLIDDGRFTGASETIVDLWKKAEVMEQIAAERGIALSEVCYVGDHMNDVPVMQIVGLGIAFNPKDDKLERVADHVTRDFAEIPELIETFQTSSL